MNDDEQFKEINKVLSEVVKREAYLRSLCISMRLAQVEYFSTKSQQSLVRAKGAESRLDKELFGTPLKANNLIRGESGELIYGDYRNNRANGDVQGGQKETRPNVCNTRSILGSGECIASDRRVSEVLQDFQRIRKEPEGGE